MAIEKNITFEGVSEKNMTKVFSLAYRRAFTKSVEYLFSKVFEYAPVGKTKSGVVNLRNALKWDFDWKKNEGFIGVPKGSEMEKIAFYTEMGCFFNPYYTILTKDGKKRFMDLTEDDYVFTHKLRWRKIQKIHRVPIEEVNKQARVTLEDNSYMFTTLDHPYLVERDGKDIWVEAKDLKEGDIVYKAKLLYNNTKEMREKYVKRMRNRIITKKTRKKMSKNHWLKNEGYEDIKEKWKIKIGLKSEGNKSVLGKRWKLKGEAKEKAIKQAMKNIKNLTPEQHKKQGESLRKFYLKHPEKHPNYILAKNGRTSKEQLYVYNLFKEKYPDAILEHPIRTKRGIRFADIVIPSLNLVVEYDGSYWHNDNTKERDLKRQRLIENEGWNFISFNHYSEAEKYLRGEQ